MWELECGSSIHYSKWVFSQNPVHNNTHSFLHRQRFFCEKSKLIKCKIFSSRNMPDFKQGAATRWPRIVPLVDPQSYSALLLESTTLFNLPKFSRSTMMMMGVIGLIKLHQTSFFFPSSSVHCRPPRPHLAPKSHWMKKRQNIRKNGFGKRRNTAVHL